MLCEKAAMLVMLMKVPGRQDRREDGHPSVKLHAHQAINHRGGHEFVPVGGPLDFSAKSDGSPLPGGRVIENLGSCAQPMVRVIRREARMPASKVLAQASVEHACAHLYQQMRALR